MTEQLEKTAQDIGAVQTEQDRDTVQTCTVPAREFSAVLAATDSFRATKSYGRPVLELWKIDLDPTAQTLTVSATDSYCAVIATVQLDDNFPTDCIAPMSFCIGQNAKLADVVKVCAGPVIGQSVTIDLDKIAQTARISGASSSVTIDAPRDVQFPNMSGLWPNDRRGMTEPMSLNPANLARIHKSMTAAHKCAGEPVAHKSVALICSDALKPALFAYDIAEISLSVEILIMPIRVN